MKINAIAFGFLEPQASVLLGYKKITLYMIFNVKNGFYKESSVGCWWPSH